MKNIIYGLECPNSGKVYYIGKSEKGLERPYQHLSNSHNPELNKWISSLSSEPVIKIYERNCLNLLEKERYWINVMISRKEPLINKIIPLEKQLKYVDYSVSRFIKEQRKINKLTQMDLASKAGVGLRFIRDLESGKETLKMDKILQVLILFGATLIPYKK